MRIVLCGDTPGIRQLLMHIPHECVVGIIAASIRPQYLQELKALSESLQMPLLIQPKWKSTEYESFSLDVNKLRADLIWVNSYSMIIRDDVLSATRLGGLNLHGALLPRYRGCNPTQWSILNHEHETGVTLHEMDSGLDTGPIVDQRKVPIFFEDTWVNVKYRLEAAIDELLRMNVPRALSKNWSAKSQLHDHATVGRRRVPADGVFSWSEPVVDIHNKIRALVPPLPPAHYYSDDGKRIEISEYRTPWQVTLCKYSPDQGRGIMRSEHIRLRPLQKTDAPLLYEWITDQELVIHNAPYWPVSETDHELWVERMMTKRSDLVIFVIEEMESGTVIGICQLLNINWVHRSAELEIRIGNSSYHKGHGAAAVSLLSDFGFSDLNLHRIYLYVFANNSRMIRTYEKCGFQQEGILRGAAFIDGEWNDVFVMRLFNSNE